MRPADNANVHVVVPPLTFLVVDDDEDSRYLAGRALMNQFATCRVIACSSAKKARSCLTRVSVDAILTDHKLGEESGIEFIRGLRQQGVTCPVVMVTASADPEVERAAYEAGANKVFSAGRGDFTGYLHEVLSRV